MEALDDILKKRNSLSRVSQTLTYRDYYARYGTTEEQDGWRMVKPKEGNVYYERN